MVHALGLVGLQREIGMRGAKAPDLHGAVQARRGERIRVLGVDRQAHNIMAVTLVHLNALPALLPIPQLDGHVIGGGEDKRLGRVDGNRANVVGMGLERSDLLGGVVVVDTELEVI